MTEPLKLDSYQSNIPVLQVPPEQQGPQPLPAAAGHVSKVGGIAYLGDKLLSGYMQGRDIGALHKAQQAQYSMGVAKQNEDKAWQTYQDALRTGQAKQGDANDPAYQAYIKAQDAGTQMMKQYAMPEEKPKGKQQGQKKKDGDQQPDAPTVGGRLMDFIKGNPHFVPQLALAMRVPNKPVMSAETEETKNTLASQGNQLTLQGQQIDSNKRRAVDEQREQQQQQMLEKVDQMGGIDKVAADKSADPQLRAMAQQKVSERLDKEGVEGQLKDKLFKDVQSGNTGSWTQADRLFAAHLGLASEPKEMKFTGKNGHEMTMLVDPQTNQPIPGSKPLDLGPPQWAQQYYGERAAEKKDIQNAVSKNPEVYGVTLTGDKKTDQARIDAATTRLFAESEEHIRAATGTTGKTGYEVQRDNTILQDSVKDTKDGPGKANFEWPGESKPVNLSREDAGYILNQFITNPNETPGVYTFRANAEVQGGKDAGAAERDRKWAYQLVKDRMMAQKGKKAMTSQEADAILANTALGKPIPQTAPSQSAKPQGGMDKPPSMPSTIKGWFTGDDGQSGMTKPPEQQSSSGSQGEPPEGAVAVNAQGVKAVYVNGQWLNQETMEPVQ